MIMSPFFLPPRSDVDFEFYAFVQSLNGKWTFTRLNVQLRTAPGLSAHVDGVPGLLHSESRGVLMLVEDDEGNGQHCADGQLQGEHFVLARKIEMLQKSATYSDFLFRS